MQQRRILHALSERFRRGRDVQLRAIIAACPKRGEYLEVLDVGGRSNYWRRVGYDFLMQHKVRVTIINLNTAEIPDSVDAPTGLFRSVFGDGRALDFADGTFDLCHSNSVIEHVGRWPDMYAFACETRRVAASYYVQTPNYWFPIDPHFAPLPGIHWMPRHISRWFLQRMSLATAGKARDREEANRYLDSAQLLTRRQMCKLFPDSRIMTERLMLLSKSFIATRMADTCGALKKTESF